MDGHLETILDDLTPEDLHYLGVAKRIFIACALSILPILIITLNTAYFYSFLMFIPGCLIIAGTLDLIIGYKTKEVNDNGNI